jgi:hypothetical protein
MAGIVQDLAGPDDVGSARVCGPDPPSAELANVQVPLF